MTRTIHSTQHSRSTRGNVVTRVLLFIVGITLLVCGVLFGLVTVVMLLEEDFDVLFLLPFTISAAAGGAYIIYSLVHTKRGAGTQLRGTRQQPTIADAPSVPEQTAVPVAETPVHEHVAERPKEPLRQPNEPEATETNTHGPTDEIAALVARSDDLFASLRDLVRHDSARGATPDKHHLATMLDAAGIMAWQDAPACEGGRLSRTTHYWIRLSPDDLDATQYDTLISAEAALGVNQDLPDVRTKALDDPATREATLQLMRTMCEQSIDQAQLTEDGLQACYRTQDSSGTTQDWLIRSTICNAAECIRTPFRVVMSLRVNIDSGLVVFDLEIPRPGCMAIFTPDPSVQIGLARAYAIRLAVLLGRHAFSASELVARVVVNCHEQGHDETLVSLDINRPMLGSLRKAAKDSSIETGFPSDAKIRASFEDGWFVPIEPFVSLRDAEATPARSRIFPELDQRLAPEAIARTCHAKRICDLGINENAGRVSAWQSIYNQLGSTTEKAVSTLKAARDSASDITVAEACNRTMQALVNGEADLENLDRMATLFVDGSSLDKALDRAVGLLNDEEGHQDPEAALRILQTALDPIDSMGVYLDDETSVYRYFGSVSERIHHNRVIDEGGREIKLVPDAYYNAHSNASIALGMMEHHAEALEHADICLRLAPTSTHATMRKVRILESQSRIYEAADLIIAALRHAVTPRDAAICHYRLAYMEWKLGREDLAAACYVRSLHWDTEMSAPAREELDDLIDAMSADKPPTSEQAEALLAREGIPLGCVRTDEERTLAAAVACMDGGALISARPLMAALYAMTNDDVVISVYRSLNVEV